MYDSIAHAEADGTYRSIPAGAMSCEQVLTSPVIDQALRAGSWPSLSLVHDSAQGPEACRIAIAATGPVRLYASTAAGAFYGLQTLKRLRRDDGAFPGGVFADWPDCAFRGYHFTLDGGMAPSMTRMRELIEQLAEWRYNKLVIEYDNRFPLSCHPELVHPNAWSLGELKALIAFAEDHFMEVVPELDSLGHVKHYLSHPDYAHLAEEPGKTHEMCPQNPQTLALMEEIWSEVIACHANGSYVHLGCDEVFLVEHFCPRCRPYAESGRLAELYCDYVSRLSRFILARGKTPIIWGDMLLKYPQQIHKFPREVIICDWQYVCNDDARWPFNALTQMNPRHNGSNEHEALFARAADAQPDGSYRSFPSFDFFHEQGFTVIGSGAGSIGPSSYYLPHQTLSVRNQYGVLNALRRQDSLGYLHTIWGNTGGVEYCMYSAFAGGEYAWRTEPARHDDIRRLFNRDILHAAANDDPIVLADRMYDFIYGRTEAFTAVAAQDAPAAPRFQRLLAANLELGAIDSELRSLARARIANRQTTDFAQLDLMPVANARLRDALASEQNPFLLPPGRYCLGAIALVIDPDHVVNLDREHCRAVDLPLAGRCNEFQLALSGTYAAKGVPMLKCVIRYQNGSEHTQVLCGTDDIPDWYGMPSFGRNNTPVATGANFMCNPGCIGLACVRNPHAGEALASLRVELIAANPRANVVLAAASRANADAFVQPHVDLLAWRERLENNVQRQCRILDGCLKKGDFEDRMRQRLVESRLALIARAFAGDQ